MTRVKIALGLERALLRRIARQGLDGLSLGGGFDIVDLGCNPLPDGLDLARVIQLGQDDVAHRSSRH